MHGGLIGCDAEVAALEDWIADPRAGLALIEGAAGIGKTTVWRHVCALAAQADFAVSTSTPAESERQLVFAGLADLLAPVLPDALDTLPPARRGALEAALLLGEPQSQPADERAVAFAALDVLRSAARERPLVLAIDDAQWFDRSSAAVIAFALRRLTPDDRVRALVARRTDVEDDASLALVEAVDGDRRTVTEIDPMSLGALHRLYRERLELAFSRPRIVRIHEICGGNPFFALEIGRALAASPAASGDPPIPASLAEAVGVRLSELSPPAQRIVLLAAAAAQPTLHVLALAAPDVDLDATTAEGVAAGVFVAGTDPLRFEHPLLAAASYAFGTDGDRRAAHLALAEVVGATEQRARHLAIGQAHPDADAAAALDAAADAAAERGAQAGSGELREWAAAMTPSADAGLKAGRLLEAGNAMYLAGDATRARDVLERVASAPGPRQHEALWRLGTLLDETIGWSAAQEHWLRAVETDDLELRIRILGEMAISTMYVVSVETAAVHSKNAVATAEQLGDARLLAFALAVDALVRTLGGDSTAPQVLARALQLEPGEYLLGLAWSPVAVAADCARLTMDLDGARNRFERIHDLATERGDIPVALWAAYGRGQIALEDGNWDLAETLSGTVGELAEQLGFRASFSLRLGARLAALRGDAAVCQTLSALCIEEARTTGELLHELNALGVLGGLELSAGDAAGAVRTLDRGEATAVKLGVRASAPLRFAVDQAEALVALDRLDEAEDKLADFERSVANSGARWAQPLIDRGRGLVAAARGDLEEGARLMRAAADDESLALPLERARIDLCLGRVLRRQKRKLEAREALDRALGAFDELGSRLWADQARAELARIGGRSRVVGLTATEAQVAALVAGGKSNKATAAALFVTASTVEAHLSRIYAKLGIRSRNELRAALAEQTMGFSRLSTEEPAP